jgi:death on curing protein
MCEGIFPQELRHIHEDMLESYGGLPGEKEPGMIHYVCEKPFMFGRYPLLFEKAAVLMISIATGHYFVDANKRTAYMATYIFLLKNGHEIIVSNEEMFETARKVAKREMSQEELTKWLADNSEYVDPDEIDNIDEEEE